MLLTDFNVKHFGPDDGEPITEDDIRTGYRMQLGEMIGHGTQSDERGQAEAAEMGGWLAEAHKTGKLVQAREISKRWSKYCAWRDRARTTH
jgi:hypothetical protein